MAVDDKCPQWIRLDTHDTDSREVSYILGGRSEADLANYGRLCILRQIIVRSGEGYIDVGDERHLSALGYQLGIFDNQQLVDFVRLLLDSGACERAAYEAKGWLMMPDAWNQLSAYQSQVRANRANGAKGGRPRKRQDAPEATPNPAAQENPSSKPSQNPTETQAKPNRNPSKTQAEPNQNPDETQPEPEPSSREEKTIYPSECGNPTGRDAEFSTIPDFSTHAVRDGPLAWEPPLMRHARDD